MLMDKNDFTTLQNVWETLAKTDPLWAILSLPSKKGRKWDVEEFFWEGRVEIDHVLGKVLNSGHTLSRGTALDFGCGVGRLTQPLADYFAHVVGVDISSTMIDLARQFNRRGARVEYRQNSVKNLGVFGDQTFDFVYSNIVLQHMHPQYAIGYIKEFFRITKTDGFIVFQIPSHLTEAYLPHDYVETPLPEMACRADLQMVCDPTTVQAGEVATVTIKVTNISAEDWIQRRTFQLNVGNRWLLPDKRTVVVHDDGRSRLPGRVPARANVSVPLTIKMPDQAGRYVLQIDLVQEGVRWFQDVGSTPLLVPIQVEAARVYPAATMPLNTGSVSPPIEPCAPGVGQPLTFMMEGVRKEVILSLIADANARLVTTEEHVTEWYSYKYYVIR